MCMLKFHSSKDPTSAPALEVGSCSNLILAIMNVSRHIAAALFSWWPAKTNSCHASALLQNLKGKLANTTCAAAASRVPRPSTSENFALDGNPSLMTLNVKATEYFICCRRCQSETGDGALPTETGHLVSLNRLHAGHEKMCDKEVQQQQNKCVQPAPSHFASATLSSACECLYTLWWGWAKTRRHSEAAILWIIQGGSRETAHIIECLKARPLFRQPNKMAERGFGVAVCIKVH